MKTVRLAGLVLFFLSFSAPANPAPGVEEKLRAIVRIRARIPGSARTARSLGREREGNGVVIDSDGHILTIGYLILEAESIEVTVPGGKRIRAAFAGYDHATGFGLVRASEPLGIAPLEFGRSSEVKPGDAILVAGYGGQRAVQGVRVVSRREFAGYWEYLLENAIFSSPPYSDFAGAAMLGMDGRLLGVGSLFSRTVVPGVGIVPGNMFVPIDLLKPILADLKAKGRASRPARPWMGLFAEEVRGRIFVNRVSPDGPAARAGVKPGDIVLEVRRSEVKSLADFYRKVWALGGAGVKVPIRVLQGNRIENLTIHSADRSRFLRLK